MKILVIDDLRDKYFQIKRILEELFEEPTIEYCRSFISAISAVEVKEWDLVVLDMSFDVNEKPIEGEGFNGVAGLQLLQHLYRMDIETSVIIFTAHTEFDDPSHPRIDGLQALRAHLEEHFDELCIGCIYSKDPDEKIKKELWKIWNETST